jgi:transcriptional antiterminator NusG
MNAKYYSVRVASGRENKARNALFHRAQSEGAWGNTIFDIIVPTSKEYATRAGKRKIVDKKIFPGYLFIKMYFDEQTEKIVQGTDGISGFVRSGKNPTPIEDHEIQNILKNIDNTKESPKSEFKTNDIVLVIAGPFSEFTGKIVSVDEDKGKVKALVNIFGRDTIAEFDIQDVEINV